MMADDDDDEIVICRATLTAFACAYLSANRAYGLQSWPSTKYALHRRPLMPLSIESCRTTN